MMKLIRHRGKTAFTTTIILLALGQAVFAQTVSPSAESLAHQAIEAYGKGDFSTAQSYFAQVPGDADRSLLHTVALYRAEIALKSDKTKGIAAGAQILADCAAQTKLNTADTFFGKMRASQARFAGLAQDWKNCEIFADAVLNSSKDAETKKTALYWKALSLFETEKYSRACKTIESDKSVLASDTTLSVLYVKSLIKADRAADAGAVFADLAKTGRLDNETRLDYAQFLLNSGRLQASREQASQATGAQALYVQGLAAFNQRKWEDAAHLMNQSLKEKPAMEEKYTAYAQFYAGYAQYRTGNYSAAYTSLTSFVENNPLHSLRYDALMTAARSAVQSNQTQKAFPLAEQAIYAASTDEQQNEAVLLAAGVYADAGKYDKAIAILSPRASGRNQFAYQCRYEMARIQAQKKDYVAADKTYAALASDKLTGSIGEEAAYRRGELQYSQEKYAQAATLFDEYIKRWNGGQFYDAALYFNADSLAKSGQIDRAILYFMQVDNLRTESTYKYNAEKNLVDLYQSQGDYASALSYANKLLATYGDQARDDGIAKTADELQVLSKGGNAALLKKEKEYENAGKTSTEKGRAVGTELVQLYVASDSTRAKGISLAEQLLPKQTAPQESRYAAQNALLLAQQYRANNENKKSAQMYLTAAQYARAAGNDENAARALYGAVEAFDAAGLSGDAKAAADSLENLYPTSNFARSAKQIVNQ